MVAGDSLLYSVGQSDAPYNMGQLYFVYAGAGSTSNRLSMGLHSTNDVFNILGTGNVGIGTTAPTARLTVQDALASPTGNIFQVANANDSARYLTVSSISTTVAATSALG